MKNSSVEDSLYPEYLYLFKELLVRKKSCELDFLVMEILHIPLSHCQLDIILNAAGSLASYLYKFKPVESLKKKHGGQPPRQVHQMTQILNYIYIENHPLRE